MASADLLPMEQLLNPIPGDNAAGGDIRASGAADSAYYQIKEARNAARAAERNNLFEDASNEADDHWRKVAQLAPDILQHQAKDLEIASWYTEALIRQHGFQGLRDGFRLIRGLIETYWDNLHPMPDEDGVATRVASLTGLNGEGKEGVLISPIRNVPITQGSDPGPFSLWKYQQVLEVEKVLDEELRQEKSAKLGFGPADLDRAVADSSEAFYVDLLDDITTAIDEFTAVGELLDQLCGSQEAPPTSNILNTLRECKGAIKHVGKYKLPDPETSLPDEEQESANMNEAHTTAVTAAAGPIRTSDDSFRQLTEISRFFRKTEPHSPISYYLERAVKWGDMSLEDLIRELIPDSSARDFYGSLTGIRTDDE